MIKNLSLIFGMHRSGTSALAGFFHKILEYNLPKGPVIPPSGTNYKGHFESCRVVCLNDRILQDYHAAWDTPKYISPAEQLQNLNSVMDTIHQESVDNLVIKDPRIMLLSPLWFRAVEMLTEDCDVVVNVYYTMRSQPDIIASLVHRNQFTEGQATALTIAYYNIYKAHLMKIKHPVIVPVWYKDQCSWYQVEKEGK